MTVENKAERRARPDRREADRRRLRQDCNGNDRRAVDDRRRGERRAQIEQDYHGAIERAKAALIAHGMDSPEFADAARTTENLSTLLREIDRAPGHGIGA